MTGHCLDNVPFFPLSHTIGEDTLTEFKVERKLQEQSGSYFVFLPKIWVEANNLSESDLMTIRFNGDIHIVPTKRSINESSMDDR